MIQQASETHINYHMLFSSGLFTASFFSCDIRLRLTPRLRPYSVAPLSLMMFSSSESEVRYTRLFERAIVAAMSLAVYASLRTHARTLMRRSSMKPGLFSIASPIRRADVASPSARMIVDFLSCFACSTTYLARSASCWATSYRLTSTPTHLLGFDGVGELATEGQVDDGDIVDHDTELATALDQVALDQTAHLLSLCKKGGGVELSDHLLQHFVHDGRHHALVPVYGSRAARTPTQSKLLVCVGKDLHIRVAQDSERNIDHLQI